MGTEEFNRLLGRIKYDKNALGEIYDFYYSRTVLSLSMRYSKNLVEDAVQQFFLNLLKAERFNFIRYPASWIYRSCDNLIRQRLGDKELAFSQLEDLDDNDKIVANVCDPTVDIVERVFEHEGVRKLFDNIDDFTTKKIFFMYYMQGYNLREVAENLHMKNSTVKQRHVRCIRKLSKRLKDVAAKEKKALNSVEVQK